MRQPVNFYSEGVRLVGDVYYPDDLKTGATHAGVVLCHGYTGVKDLYLPDNARVLTEHGYVALTFDYKGWGESEGPRTRLAPYSRVADAQAALSFLSTLPEADAERLGLYGARQDARAGVAERGHPAVGGDVHRIRARGVHRRYQPRPKAGGRMPESCGLKSGRSTKE